MADDLTQIKRELEQARRVDLARQQLPEELLPEPFEGGKETREDFMDRVRATGAANRAQEQELDRMRRQKRKSKKKEKSKEDPRKSGFMKLKGIGNGPFLIGGLITGTLDLSNILGLISFGDGNSFANDIIDIVFVGGASTSYMITKMIVDPKKGMQQKFVANRILRVSWPVVGEAIPLWKMMPFWSVVMGLLWRDARKHTKKLSNDQDTVAGGDNSPLDDPAYADLDLE